MFDLHQSVTITRRLGLTFLAGGLALSLAACGGSSNPNVAAAGEPGTGDAGGTRTIAFVMGASADPFFKAMLVGAEAEAKAKGIDLIWEGDSSEYSPATQIPIVDQVLAKKPDGLVLIPTDPDALQPAVVKATAQGVLVVNVDTQVTDQTDVLSFITGDNADGGAKAADAIATAIGYEAGGSYQVVVGLTSNTATTNVARLDGFQTQLAAKYPEIEVVDTAYSQSKPEVANTNVNNWLIKYPDLNGIFAIDGSNATGAASALQAKGLVGKVALVGYDAYPDNVALLQKGVFTALIAQDPATEAKMAIDYLLAKLDGDDSGIEKTVTIPNVVLTKDTSAADFLKYTYVS